MEINCGVFWVVLFSFEGYKLENPELESARRRCQRDMLDLQSGENATRREREEQIEQLKNQIERTIGDKAEDDHRRVMAVRRADAMECARTNAKMVYD